MKKSVFYHHMAEAASQKGMAIQDIIRQVHSLGIGWAEVDLADLKRDNSIADMLKNEGMGISSIYGFYDFGGSQNGSAGFEHVQLAKKLGCEKVMIIPGFYTSDDKAQCENEREKMLAAMKQMCEYAQSEGIVPTIEDFDDCKSPIATAEQMMWFAERIPQLMITFDTGNFMYSGQSELDAFELLKDRIVHVHCKDRSLIEKPHCEMKMTVDGKAMYPAPVGSGCIKMKEIIASLDARGYDGIYTIEHFGAEDQLMYIKRSAEFLERAL